MAGINRTFADSNVLLSYDIVSLIKKVRDLVAYYNGEMLICYFGIVYCGCSKSIHAHGGSKESTPRKKL